LAKTFVKTGEGKALVLSVGVNTRSGMAGEKLDMEDDPTPLQQKLGTIADQIGKIGLSVAILTFVTMTVKYTLEEFVWHEEFPSYCAAQTLKTPECQEANALSLLKEVVHFFIIAITVVVVAIPEGLPLAVTISLAYSVMKMKQENNLVRKLDASETMGGADQICTDKTGTLTQNIMSVKGLWTLDKIHQNENLDSLDVQALVNKELLAQGILFNCSARIERSDTGLLDVKGNCTEQGCIRFLIKKGYQTLEIQEQKFGQTASGTDRIVATIPFNSQRKKGLTAVQLKGDNGQEFVRVLVKGAPEYMLDLCTEYQTADGSQARLDTHKKEDILREVVKENFARQAFRTLLIAYTDLSLEKFNQLKSYHNGFQSEADRIELENQGLTVIGIFGMQDPLRPEVKAAVKKCHSAGITIRMVTGDNLDTAKAIAIDAGILTEEEANDTYGRPYAFMDGQTFRRLTGGLVQERDAEGKVTNEYIQNMERFKDIASQLKVLARSTPDDKYMLVSGLKALEKVVAVTGDGTNDAPALKKADVGFAMGIAGTEVAKDSSDIIILDDNFSSIVTAIKWGRNIYTNVRKFLQFQLTVNVVAMFIVFIGSVVLRDPPLTSVQMLWVNLIMDTCGALALATEPPAEELLQQKPYPRSDPIVTPTMMRNIIG
jgi:P-type Ca2+ transporter type 2B